MMPAVTHNDASAAVVERILKRRRRARLPMALVVAAILMACDGPTTEPEESLRRWVRQGHEAAENKDRRALVDMISPAYKDSRGNDRKDIENRLRAYFLRQHKVALITRIEELTIIDDSAAELMISFGTAGTNDNALGFSANAYRLAMELEYDGDDWSLIAARWGQLGGELH